MSNRVELDYLIIGAGPAGLQLGYFLQKNGREYLILESGDSVGVFFNTYPRHRKLLSINKRYTGYQDPEARLRYDWNSLLCEDAGLRFESYSKRYFPDADDFKRYLVDFAQAHELNIKYNTRVCKISRDGAFVVLDDLERIASKLTVLHCDDIVMVMPAKLAVVYIVDRHTLVVVCRFAGLRHDQQIADEAKL